MARLLLWLIGVPALLSLMATASICIIGLRDDIRPSDVIIVLGSKIKDDGAPSVHLALRLERTLALYREGLAPKIIVSGGPGIPNHLESQVMRGYLIARGVPTDAIIEDPTGINTAATARNAVSLMARHEFKSAMIVTEYFHVARTRQAFARQGLPDVRHAHASYPLLRDVLAIGREVVGLPLYWLGWRHIAETN